MFQAVPAGIAAQAGNEPLATFLRQVVVLPAGARGETAWGGPVGRQRPIGQKKNGIQALPGGRVRVIGVAVFGAPIKPRHYDRHATIELIGAGKGVEHVVAGLVTSLVRGKLNRHNVVIVDVTQFNVVAGHASPTARSVAKATKLRIGQRFGRAGAQAAQRQAKSAKKKLSHGNAPIGRQPALVWVHALDLPV